MTERRLRQSDAPGKNQKQNAQEAALTAIRVAIEQKGLDVKGLSLEGVSDIADYFVIISGTSDRHVQGMAEKIEAELKKLGESARTSGYERSEWILLDYGDLIVHVFYEPIRQYYLFDELWKNAKPLTLPEELEVQARKLRTGMYR